jgi:hypothetical protein
VTLGWEELVAIVIALLVAGLVLIVFLTRDPRNRRVRLGVFLERDSERPEEPRVEDPGTQELPPS